MTIARKLVGIGVALALGLALGVGASRVASGQTPETAPSRDGDLRGVIDQLQRSEAEQSRLKSEVAGLKGDRAKLNTELIKTGDSLRKAEQRLADAEGRLEDVTASEAALRRSLEVRRGLITEVLATLQRMGRKPPPAVIVRPEDMLEAIRSAIVLGHVLPEIRAEAEALANDLAELIRLKAAASDERRKLKDERDRIEGERARLAALVEARQGQIETSERALNAERQRVEDFSRQAQSLKDLIARTEAELAAGQRGADQARKTPAPASPGQDMAALASTAFKDPARLAPKIALSDARGLLNLPTNGPIIRAFGASDGSGGTERGITISARPGNIVTAPSDGWIMFSAPYRSYGRVLIINAGNGYNFVLTGLQTTSVEIGQFVLAGEPLGTMGSVPAGNVTAAEVQTGQSLLYVELRKDNQPIDPSPWWAKTLSEKARG